LYRKHNTQQRLSYALNAIAEIEIGETKTPYEGTLDALYKKDFERFIEYNRQDVMLIVKIDQKLQFLELANQIAHANCVLLKTTMGTVSLVEQAIINGFHEMGRVVPDRPARDRESDDDNFDEEDHDQVVGAYVADPKAGLHDWVGCVDLASLYPSTIRALNMSPETLVGQVLPIETTALIQERVAKLSATKRAEAWEGLFCTLEVSHMQARDDTVLTVEFYDRLTDVVETRQMTGATLYDYVFNADNKVCISANGTLFNTASEGMIPALLAKWYHERESMQAQMKYFADLAEQAGNGDRTLLLEQSFFWNQRQLASKIRLNATYGALLQRHFRFNDERLGQSTTLSGRTIVKHMNAKINQILTGEYDHQGDACISGDTDSCYFSAHALKDRPDYAGFAWSADNVIQLYDMITEDTNATFPTFMRDTFNTSLERGAIIRAGRELVASRGLFIKKKKYAVLMIDKEGHRLDVNGKPGKLKAMGLDLKRSDTPKFMQVFLESLLMDVLTGVDQQTMYNKVKAFRQAFKTRPGWEKGSPKKVSDLSVHADDLAQLNKRGLSGRAVKAKKSTTPQQVQASLNYHALCDIHNDRYAMRITDSARIIVCKLLANSYAMNCIAYPIDELQLPSWFKKLPFDHVAMEDTIIDMKLSNLVGVLGWDLSLTKERAAADLFVF
jgi:DNA polymerase elongation subunit (family B)